MTTSNAPFQLDRRAFLLAGGSLFLAACGSSSGTSSSASTSSPTGGTSTGGSTVAGGTATVPSTGTTASGYRQLWIPPTIDGTTFDLTVDPSTSQMLDGDPTATYAYNGSGFWGPTLIMNRGDTVTLNVTNNLAEETTTHWHGFHIPAEMDGGPMQTIAPGATWSPTFEVKNRASTYWYHPHMHTLTWKQMNLGAGGFIIINDPEESAVALPRTYGVDDIPLVLTSRTFDDANQIDTTTIYGDRAVANGVVDAGVGLPAQLVRFRVLNAEIERVYNIGFGDGRTFHVIGTDGGLLDAPVEATQLIIAPGERYEIVVDLSGDAVGSSLEMQSFNGGQPFGFPGGEDQTSGAFGSLLNNTTFTVLHIDVIAATAGAVTELPSVLAGTTLWTAADATNARTIAITDEGPGSPFTFDNAGYDMMTTNQTVQLDAIENWTIANGQIFGHSFHIHDVQFAIVSRSTGEVPAHEQGWKDTFYIRIGESVSFVAKFDDFASNEHPFMYHCHMSNHEDEGLMGQFLVVG